MQLDLFGWWVLSISSSIVFLTLVSIYIYGTRNGRSGETKQKGTLKDAIVKFAFVWVLIGLLVFYIVTVQMRSSLVFAAGNIVVEIALIAYLLKNKTSPRQKQIEAKQTQTVDLMTG
jgi:Flp pilus assembly protein TadB